MKNEQRNKSHTQTQKIGHRTLFVAGRINFVITQFTGFDRRALGGTS
jgi:uncharacterized membrane protein